MPASNAQTQRSLRGGSFWSALTALLLWGVGRAAVPSSKECELEAAFVYNFTKFVEWPADSFAAPQAPIVLGVLGESPCVDALRAIVADHQVNGRPLQVKVVKSAEQIRPLHVLLVSTEYESLFESLIGELRATPVLTVGEAGSFGASGGTITFVPVSDKLRFEINMTAAEHAGLKVSSQLQKLAINIRKEP
jgi:hypothetical protein